MIHVKAVRSAASRGITAICSWQAVVVIIGTAACSAAVSGVTVVGQFSKLLL